MPDNTLNILYVLFHHVPVPTTRWRHKAIRNQVPKGTQLWRGRCPECMTWDWLQNSFATCPFRLSLVPIELPWLLYLSNGFTFFFVNSSHILRRKTHGITCFYISYFLISKIIIILFSVPEYFACMNVCASQVCLVVFKDVQRGWGSDTLNLKLQAIMSHHVGAENGDVLCKSSECSQPQQSLSNSWIACFLNAGMQLFSYQVRGILPMLRDKSFTL